jgi:SSS family solute:Na+ symporter
MHLLDWIIVAGYVVVSLLVGVALTRKASANLQEFYLAGRSLPWWVAGTSLVATSFSADTPLFVAGLVRREGVFGNWFWWSTAFAAIATVFFFARLWRRLDIVTDVEFLIVRYDDSPARTVLRVFRVLFDGVLVNCIIMASVTLAASKLIQTMLQLSDEALVTLPLIGGITSTTLVMLVLGLIALFYTTLSGLYGVVYTDLIQFGLAMIGAISLAVAAYLAAAANGPVMPQITALKEYHEQQTQMFPPIDGGGLALFTFLVYVLFSWWGAAPGNGFAIQRLLATRSERDSMLAFLWYSVCHFVVRSWPWIMVGLISMIFFPTLDDPETAYPLMIDKFLPVGLKGIMVASLLAAFMSTLDTHLNWGSSYLINDLYKPHLKPGGSDTHYVGAARWSMVLLTAAMLIVTTQITGILEAYKYLGVLTAGIGTVMVARWYWWRVNVYSEVSAMIASLVIGNIVTVMLPDQTDANGTFATYFGHRFLINMVGSTVIWVGITLLMGNEPSEQAKAFFRKTGVGGPGWRRVAESTHTALPAMGFGYLFLGWITGCVFILGLLLGVGEALLIRPAPAAIYIGVSIAAGVLLVTYFSSLFRNRDTDS